jgi:uncharacterized integral membrane protein (TIGR00698 family)
MNAEALASLASMEGLDVPLDARPTAPSQPILVPPSRQTSPYWYGYMAAALVAGIALAVHQFYKPVSAAILAILLGALVRNLVRIPPGVLDGCKSLVRKVIPITIVLTGATLNLTDLAKGLPYLTVVLLAVASGTLAALAVGRMLGATPHTALLIGAGTSICGNSAVIATAPVVRSNDDDLLLSLGTINVLGLLILLLLPLAGGGLSMSQEAFGVWAGATVHAVPQAVTAGFAFGPQAGALATLVKLVRVTMLAPYILVLALLARRREPAAGPIRYMSLLPPFLWGFAGLAVVGTLGFLPDLVFHPAGTSNPVQFTASQAISSVGTLLLTLSMAAMGLEVNLKHLVRTGGPALLTGAAASILQCLCTWLAIRYLLPR